MVAFHEVFLNNVKMFGRVNETLLMGAFEMRTSLADLKQHTLNVSGVIKNLRLGLDMLKRGRLSLFPRLKGRGEVKRLFKES